MRYLKPYKIFEADKPEYDTDWKRPGNPVREELEVELREILLEVIDMGYRPQLSGFTKGFSESGPYVWICNQRRKSHDEFWNEITDTVERIKDYLTEKRFNVSQEIINEGTRNEQVYIYFNMSNLNESFDDDADTMARYQLFGADTTMAFDFNREYITDVESIKDLIEKYNHFYVSGNSWSGGPPPKDFIEYFNKNYSKKGDASMKTWYPTIDLMIETLNYGTLILGFSIIDKSYKLINWSSLAAVGEYAGKDVAYDKRVLSEISKYINKELIDKLKLDEVVEILNLKIKNKVDWDWNE